MSSSNIKKIDDFIDINSADMYYDVIKHILKHTLGQVLNDGAYQDLTSQDSEMKRFFEDVEKMLHILKDEEMHSILCERVYSRQKYADILEILSKKLNFHYKSFLIFNNIRDHGYHVYFKPLLRIMYDRWVDEYCVMHAQLITAVACDVGEIDSIEKELSEYYKKKVLLKNIVHPRALGGCKLKINGSLIDLSYDTMLSKFLQNIEQNYLS